MEREWLENLKAGDRVIVGGRDGNHISMVVRVTKTLIILGAPAIKGNTRFRKNGTSGTGFDTFYLQEPTQELEDQIKQAAIVRLLSRYDWKKLALPELNAVWGIVKEAK